MNTQRSHDLCVAQLQTFQLVMQYGGYAAAARATDLSVPTIWQHIQALEKIYRVQLFQKAGRRVEPTNAAHRLLEQVSSVLVQLESTFDTIDDSASNQAIRLVTGVRMMMEDLAAPLGRFHQNHVNQLVIRHAHDRRAEDLLLADEADLALALEPSLRQTSQQIHYEPAYTVEFLAVASKDHPFMQSRSGTLAELSKHQLVVTTQGTHGRDALDEAFHQNDLSAKIVAETDNSAFTIACVAAGMGVGILAGRADGELCKRFATRSLSKQLGKRKIVLMWRRGRLLTNAMLDLVEEVKSMA